MQESLPDTNLDPLQVTVESENFEQYEEIWLDSSRRTDWHLEHGWRRVWTTTGSRILLNKPIGEAARIALRRALLRFGQELKRG